MKIKCPFSFSMCNPQEFDNQKSFYEHLEQQHRHDLLCQEYTRLVFKIQEKIESLNNEVEHSTQLWRRIEDLESLLEPEDKK